MIDLFWFILSLILNIFFSFVIYLGGKRYFSTKNALQEALHKKGEVSSFLSFFAKNIDSIEKINGAMDRTAKYLADLIGAKAVGIFILKDDNFLHVKGVFGPFPPLHNASGKVLTKRRYVMDAIRKEKIKFGEGFIGDVAKKRTAVLIDDATDDERFFNSPIFIESVMAVPMVSEGNVCGVVCAVNSIHNGFAFSHEQLSAFRFMSKQVVLAHKIIEVYKNLMRQQRIYQELDFARQLQASLLPEHAPDFGNYMIESFSKPAKEVSGDFYDFIPVDEDRLLVVIGDACGKGIPACLLMAMTRSFIRANVERFSTLSDMMQDLNNNLFRDSGADRFVTVSCCLLYKKEKYIEFSRAGHTELLLGRTKHPVRTIFPNGPALGLLPVEFTDGFDLITFAFLDDMSILLFSDGIVEALNSDGEEYGLDRLLKLLKKSTDTHQKPEALVETIISDVNEFAGDMPQADDQTLVVISHK